MDKSTYIIALLARRFKHTGQAEQFKIRLGPGIYQIHIFHNLPQPNRRFVHSKEMEVAFEICLPLTIMDKLTYIIALLVRRFKHRGMEEQMETGFEENTKIYPYYDLF